ncbi:MAG: hypothetical protein HFH05_10845 [Lachnospiraceae bacterium]|nr:hypothetical protein [Lachnospiraceae bacterium]MCI9677003.1 hypothetical protein [Lachnospiraceae bacterium]
MFDFMPDKIDFSDEKQYEFLQEKMNYALQSALNNGNIALERLEEILFAVQSWIQPFICQILSFESMHTFSELGNAFAYIRENQKKEAPRPYPQLEKYCEMCNQIGCILDSHDDSVYLESIHFSQEDAAMSGRNYFSELKQKDAMTQAFAFYGFSVFESYYDFIKYFTVVKERSYAVNQCLILIDNILFNVLWYLDCDCGNLPGNSCFLRAVEELFNILSTDF